MKQALTKRPWRRLSPRALGLMFLIPGLLLAIPNLIAGTFVGAILGFCTFAVVFGALLAFVPLSAPAERL